MAKPVFCNSNNKRIEVSEKCEFEYWEVPVKKLSDIINPSRDNAYVLPDESVWVLSYDGSELIELTKTQGDSDDVSDKIVEFVEPSIYIEPKNGEKLSTLFGKIAKGLRELFATKADKAVLNNYATVTQLSTKADKSDLNNYATVAKLNEEKNFRIGQDLGGDDIKELLRNKIEHLNGKPRGVYLIDGGWKNKNFGCALGYVWGDTIQVTLFMHDATYTARRYNGSYSYMQIQGTMI